MLSTEYSVDVEFNLVEIYSRFRSFSLGDIFIPTRNKVERGLFICIRHVIFPVSRNSWR